MGKRIFLGDMWAIYNFSNSNERYQKFLLNGKPRFQKLLDSIIFYDEIILPTDDFMTLTVLAGVLGKEPVLKLLETGALKFVRTSSSISYIGNGDGLNRYKVFSSEMQNHPMAADVDDAVHWAVSGLNDTSNKLVQGFVDAVKPITTDYIPKDDDKALFEATYLDAKGMMSSSERSVLGDRLNHLDGVNPDQVRIYGGPDSYEDKNDKIADILKLAHTNLELSMAQTMECDDLATSKDIGDLLQYKLSQLGMKQLESFSEAIQLKELSDIPDLFPNEAFNSKTLFDLIDLRESSSGQNFRNWFHDAIDNNETGIAKAYTELLTTKNQFQSLGWRIARYGTLAAWGIVEPFSATTAGVVDSFCVEKWLEKKTPKFFINELKQISTHRSQ